MFDRRNFLQMSAGVAIVPNVQVANDQPLMGLQARLDPVIQVPASGGNGYLARLQGCGWYSGLGSHVAWDQRGKIYRLAPVARQH